MLTLFKVSWLWTEIQCSWLEDLKEDWEMGENVIRTSAFIQRLMVL